MTVLLILGRGVTTDRERTMNDKDTTSDGYQDLTPQEIEAFEAAARICGNIEPDFTPNLMLDLRWREAVSLDQGYRDLE
jgi:hypothetical protein